MSGLQPWQKDLWKYFKGLPPVPDGYKRRWMITRKGYWRYFDVPVEQAIGEKECKQS